VYDKRFVGRCRIQFNPNQGAQNARLVGTSVDAEQADVALIER
jgi:hypothetical protein